MYYVVPFLILPLCASQDDSGKRARELVERLRSDKIEERQEAIEGLRKLGKAAVPALRRASKDANPEVAARIRDLLDDFAPEKVFRRLERAIQKAQSLQIRFTCKMRISTLKPGIPPSEQTTRGTLLLKEGNLIHLDFERTPFFKGSDFELSVISDGKKMRVVNEGHGVTLCNTPETLTSRFRELILKTGVFTYQWFVGRSLPGPGEKRGEPDLSMFLKTDLNKVFTLSDFTVGEDGRSRTLSYKVKVPVRDSTKSYEMTIWYDPKTYILQQRKFSMPFMGDSTLTTIEIYDQFLLGARLENGRFKVPKEE